MTSTNSEKKPSSSFVTDMWQLPPWSLGAPPPDVPSGLSLSVIQLRGVPQLRGESADVAANNNSFLDNALTSSQT